MVTRSAAETRARAKEEYDAYLAACPSRKVLALLSDKWVVLTMTALSEGPRRYSELRRQIAGVSQKMLTQTLRTLERNGLVDREVEVSVPITVTYSITELGRSLSEAIVVLKQWAEHHVDDLEQARARYDARPPA